MCKITCISSKWSSKYLQMQYITKDRRSFKSSGCKIANLIFRILENNCLWPTRLSQQKFHSKENTKKIPTAVLRANFGVGSPWVYLDTLSSWSLKVYVCGSIIQVYGAAKGLSSCQIFFFLLKKEAADWLWFFYDYIVVDANVNQRNDRWVTQDSQDVSVIPRTKFPANVHVLFSLSSPICIHILL